MKKSLESYANFEGKLARQKEKVHAAEADLQSDETEERNELTKSILNHLAHSIAAVKAHGEQQSLLMMYTAQSAGITVNITTVRTAERIAQ